MLLGKPYNLKNLKLNRKNPPITDAGLELLNNFHVKLPQIYMVHPEQCNFCSNLNLARGPLVKKF